MSSIANNEFQISDLIAVSYNEDYLEYLDEKTKKQLEKVTFYPDTIYFIEQLSCNDNGIYREFYTDVLYAIEIFNRESCEPFKFAPDFLNVGPFPIEYLTPEEYEKGSVTRWRLFTIFQQVNNNYQKATSKSGVKRYGTRLKSPRVG